MKFNEWCWLLDCAWLDIEEPTIEVFDIMRGRNGVKVTKKQRQWKPHLKWQFLTKGQKLMGYILKKLLVMKAQDIENANDYDKENSSFDIQIQKHL